MPDHGDKGRPAIADLILYSDPGVHELRRRKQADNTRSRRNFELHTSMRPFFRQWYEAIADLEPARVIWHHPADGLTSDLLAFGTERNRARP